MLNYICITVLILEAARKLVVVESELERAENRIDDLSLENSRLKEELRTLSNDLKSFEASDEQFAERETQVRLDQINIKKISKCL